ncbi:hypothetical protein B0H15DRAFT_954628 [Mycena belliarum]|uniref:Uncharacterized protein n=1 Tax=Mycena belliarum TaxID=1033014 RepID=A0AAD6TY00_9AGAR|nr:hypothetical protein B0H15DRAFT_954628 [Mycena belliae]
MSASAALASPPRLPPPATPQPNNAAPTNATALSRTQSFSSFPPLFAVALLCLACTATPVASPDRALDPAVTLPLPLSSPAAL